MVRSKRFWASLDLLEHEFEHRLYIFSKLTPNFLFLHNQQLDPSQLHTLSLMQSNAIKSRRALQENHGQPDVNLLSQHLSAVNIRDSEGFPDSSLPPAEQPPPVSVPDGINSSDSSQSESRSDSPHGSTSSRTSSLPGSSQPIKGGTTRCTPEPEPGCQPSPGKKSPGKKSPGKSPGKKGRPCETCDLVKDVSTVTCHNGDTVNVQGNFTCLSTHVIYYIYCELCNEGYVGRTSDPLRKRMSEHRSAILNKKNGSVANHFNLEVPKHTVKDHFRVSVIQSFPVGYDGSREEDDMIDRLGTIKHGINKNQAQQK